MNVVRWAPKGETLASAGDDGNILIWVPSEHQEHGSFGDDALGDKETWRVKHMCRSMGSEIYDLAWSPDGQFILSGSMDNIARIYNTSTGMHGMVSRLVVTGLTRCRCLCPPNRRA